MFMLRSLLQSRKFWLTLIAWLVAGYHLIQGNIDVNTFVDATVALVGILVSMIAVEDAAEKINFGGRDRDARG